MRKKDFSSARCGGGGDTTGGGVTTNPSASVLADVANPLQLIAGFGGSDRNSGPISDAAADLFFSSGAGCIGLSMLRASIDTDATYAGGNIQNAVKAAARGATVIGAPWSPPAAWKNTGVTDGGHLLAIHYTDMANQLASFKTLLAAQGVSLYGMELQNEPDIGPIGYDSCNYTTAEMVAFLKVAAPILQSAGLKCIAASPSGWNALLPSYSNAIQADGTAASLIDIHAAHQYDLTFPESPNSYNTGGKQLWQTEWSTFDAPDSSIANGLRTANLIHNSMLIGVNAWMYWDLTGKQFVSDNEGLLSADDVINGGAGARAKRFYCLGQFSRFIRPGYNRITVSGAGIGGVNVTAYTGSGAFVLVAINTNTGILPTGFNFGILNGRCPSVTPYITNDTQSLQPQTPIFPDATGVYTTSFPKNSVTTYVGALL